MYTTKPKDLHSDLTIDVTAALKYIYQRDIQELSLDSLLDEVMRIHSSKITSELYGKIIHDELVRRDKES